MNRENIYLLKAIVETKLGIKTPKLHHGRRSGVFIVHYNFASLFCLKETTCKTRKNASHFLLKALFILEIFKCLLFRNSNCHDVIKCLSMKHGTHFTEKLESLVQPGMKFGQFMYYYQRKFFIKKCYEDMTWELVPGPF